VSNALEAWVPRVYRFALRLTNDPDAADDLTQETFLRAWRRRDRLRDPAKARVWLFRVTANIWRDRLRRGRSPMARAGPLADSDLDHVPAPDRVAAGRDDLSRALDALAGLPPRQREVLYLSACDGMPPAEVAAVLGISPDAAKANLSLARRAIRRQLPDLFPDSARTE
jgi:RNA polymerase sigma-70 factor (ECF subfamily)